MKYSEVCLVVAIRPDGIFHSHSSDIPSLAMRGRGILVGCLIGLFVLFPSEKVEAAPCWTVAGIFGGPGPLSFEEAANTYGLFQNAYAAFKSAEQVAVQNATAYLSQYVALYAPYYVGCIVTPYPLSPDLAITSTSPTQPGWPGWILFWNGTWANVSGFCPGAGGVSGGIVQLVAVNALNTPVLKNPITLSQFSEGFIDIVNATCPNTQQQYTIKLSNDANSSASGDLAGVEPGKAITTLRAKVYDINNQLVPNVNIQLRVTVETNSGGHAHHNNNRPMGMVSPAEGDTGPDGSGHVFTFTAPDPAGDHKIKATCIGQVCTQEGPDKVWVGVKGLIPIPPIPDLLPQATYQLNESNGQPIGQTDIHPENHYLTPDAVIKLWNLGFRYSAIEFPNFPLLHINDASLVRGGLFDLSANWRPKHYEHRRGTVVDIRANGGPGSIPVDSAVHRTFEIIARRLGADAEIHGDGANQHYHVRLRGIRE